MLKIAGNPSIKIMLCKFNADNYTHKNVIIFVIGNGRAFELNNPTILKCIQNYEDRLTFLNGR
jgi:hypothetical protein